MYRRSTWVFALAALLARRARRGASLVLRDLRCQQPVTLTGTVTRIEWMNPHTWIYLDVKKEDGSVEAWAFEMGSPNRLMRYGWNQSSLPTGATVTIAGSQARDGSRKAAVDTVTLPDGKRLFGAQDTTQ